MKASKHFLWLALILGVLSACKKTEDPPLDIRAYVYGNMQVNYFWNEQVPQNLDPLTFPDGQAVLDATRNTALDPWSALYENGDEILGFLSSGQRDAFGFGSKWDEDDSLRVSFVYSNTPAAEAGFQRGDKILKYNGTVPKRSDGILLGRTTTFEIRNLAGEVRTVTATARPININSVLDRRVITQNGTKVGYLLFNNFIQTSVAELDEAFTFLKGQQINELILDLRYNPGGLVSTAHHLAGLLAPNNAIGQVFLREVFNNNNSSLNRDFRFEEKANGLNSLGLQRIFVITSANTASASETIINGLKPFTEVILIGEQSAGKNVGSSVLTHLGYAFLPITFQSQNAQSSADYFGGFAPDFEEIDDLNKGVGDPEEACTAAALHYIEQGSFPSPQMRRPLRPRSLLRFDGVPTLPLIDLSNRF